MLRIGRIGREHALAREEVYMLCAVLASLFVTVASLALGMLMAEWHAGHAGAGCCALCPVLCA
jgi:hypothetical protein